MTRSRLTGPAQRTVEHYRGVRHGGGEPAAALRALRLRDAHREVDRAYRVTGAGEGSPWERACRVLESHRLAERLALDEHDARHGRKEED